MRNTRAGFTLIEMLVVIFIIGVLAALILPAVQRARAAARRTQCANNLRQLGMAIGQFADTKKHYPPCGYWDTPTRLTPMRSWVVDLLPYLGRQDIYDEWDKDQPYYDIAISNNGALASTDIAVLVCPDDDTVAPGTGNLSYVLNGGFAFTMGPDSNPDIPAAYHLGPGGSATTGLGWIFMDFDGDGATGTDKDKSAMEMMGIFFYEHWPRNRGRRHLHTPRTIRDGLSSTILASENLRTGYNRDFPIWVGNWASPWAGNCLFFGSGHICPNGDCSQVDYELANTHTATPAAEEAINASRNLPEGSPWVSSNHAGAGVHIVLCDGSLRFLAENVSGSVFAKLITPAGSYLPGRLRQAPLDEKDL
ncbi:MAG: DUF1559 domain-containing protein [Planctomycetes bacterium]|nr:DUF1559 domain-containing protein [Planctomycetota bacterium]